MYDEEIPLFDVDFPVSFFWIALLFSMERIRKGGFLETLLKQVRGAGLHLRFPLSLNLPSNRKRHDALNYHGVKCVSVSVAKNIGKLHKVSRKILQSGLLAKCFLTLLLSPQFVFSRQ